MGNGEPLWPLTNTPLDDVNAAFHDGYDAHRAAAEEAGPVFVVIGDCLFVCGQGQMRSVSVTPRAFHVMKSVAHAPVAVYVALSAGGQSPADQAAPPTLQRLQAAVTSSLAAAAAELGQTPAAQECQAVLTETSAFIDRVLREGGATREQREAFAAAMGPRLLRLTDQATELQLLALHTAVEEALATLTPTQQRALEVVVVGDHQARQRSLAMQYFRKRLGEAAGAEERVAYAEAVPDVDQALALIGKRRLDRQIARAFFADDKRLQRDVLGDAAKARLDGVTLAPIPAR